MTSQACEIITVWVARDWEAVGAPGERAGSLLPASRGTRYLTRWIPPRQRCHHVFLWETGCNLCLHTILGWFFIFTSHRLGSILETLIIVRRADVSGRLREQGVVFYQHCWQQKENNKIID